MKWGPLTFYPNMYIVLVGPSGCRKGTAMNYSLDMLDELGIKLASEAITREALIRELKNSTATHVDPATGRMFNHASLTIFSPELTVFLGYQNRQLMSDMTDWYDCRNRWTYRTKNQGTDEIIGVWVNLVGGTTPGLVRETLPQEAISGGLTSRIIFIYAPGISQKVIVPYADPAIKQELLSRLSDFNMLSGEFKVTEAFIERYSDWYIKLGKSCLNDSRFGGYKERRPNHLFKLCMILCVSRTGGLVIDSCDLDRANALLLDAESRMNEVFEGMGRNPTSEVTMNISHYIKERGGKVPYDEIISAFFSDATTAEIDGILDALKRMGTIELHYEGNQRFYERRQR